VNPEPPLDPDDAPTLGPGDEVPEPVPEDGAETVLRPEDGTETGETVFSFHAAESAGPTALPADRGKSVSHFLREKGGVGADVSLPSEDLPRDVSERIMGEERYEVLGEIGRGGMGAILRLLDRDIRRPVAMKVILGHESRRRRSASWRRPRSRASWSTPTSSPSTRSGSTTRESSSSP
jgi:hypothetical protein